MTENDEMNQIAYDLDSDDLPYYTGQGLGNLKYEEAIDLSIIRRTGRGLRADKDFIAAFIPIPVRMKEMSRYSRASKNNPYICPHCSYKTPRYANMVKHLLKVHGDYSSSPKKLNS